MKKDNRAPSAGVVVKQIDPAKIRFHCDRVGVGISGCFLLL